MKNGIACGILVAAAMVTSVAGAQDRGRNNARPRGMAAGAPAEVRGLGGLIGTWEGDIQMRAGADQATVHFRWVCDATSGGYGVRCNTTMTGIPGMTGAYEETDLFGWNPNDRLYHWYSVTNAGEVHDHAGSCDGRVTTFQYQGNVDGKLFVERITMELDGRSLRVRATTHAGEQETSVVEGTVNRR